MLRSTLFALALLVSGSAHEHESLALETVAVDILKVVETCRELTERPSPSEPQQNYYASQNLDDSK